MLSICPEGLLVLNGQVSDSDPIRLVWLKRSGNFFPGVVSQVTFELPFAKLLQGKYKRPLRCPT